MSPNQVRGTCSGPEGGSSFPGDPTEMDTLWVLNTGVVLQQGAGGGRAERDREGESTPPPVKKLERGRSSPGPYPIMPRSSLPWLHSLPALPVLLAPWQQPSLPPPPCLPSSSAFSFASLGLGFLPPALTICPLARSSCTSAHTHGSVWKTFQRLPVILSVRPEQSPLAWDLPLPLVP